MPTGDEIRAQQRATWDQFSEGWEKWDYVVLAMIGPVGDEIIRSLDLRDDAHHLDVASGTGEPGLSIAQAVPNGRVVLTDLAPRMLSAARRRAVAKGIENVEMRECSADALPFEDATFDSVSCRFGFMFFPDLAGTAAELVRVLKPGGRLAASVWAEPPANPWATIPGAAIATEVDMPAPPPDAPGMFRCAAPGAMTSLFSGAGLHDVSERDVPVVMEAASTAEYWHLLTELTAPVVAVLEHVDEATRRRIADLVMAKATAYARADGSVSVPGLARCVVGTK